MKLKLIVFVFLVVIVIFGCVEIFEGGKNIIDCIIDQGFDDKYFSQFVVGIWVDLNGCDYWIIDDGFEGYFSQCFDCYGKLVCLGIVLLNMVIGFYKEGFKYYDKI